jgi:SAM-dependent methyltransferase
MSLSSRWLQHPLTRGLSVDDPRTTRLRRDVIRSKPFLRRVYQDWYGLIRASVPAGPGGVLELGSGGGFLREALPETITSDVFGGPEVRVLADGRALPFADGCLRAIAMIDVLHHVSDCRLLFAEAARCVRPDGALVAIEPWVSAWSRFVYGRLHSEPFRPEAPGWHFPPAGPLSGANQALPWIVFQRDRAVFEAEFPEWRIVRLTPFMPLRYLASGGVGFRSLVPGWTYPLFAALEKLAEPGMENLAMFVHIVLRRAPAETPAGHHER